MPTSKAMELVHLPEDVLVYMIKGMFVRGEHDAVLRLRKVSTTLQHRVDVANTELFPGTTISKKQIRTNAFGQTENGRFWKLYNSWGPTRFLRGLTWPSLDHRVPRGSAISKIPRFSRCPAHFSGPSDETVVPYMPPTPPQSSPPSIFFNRYIPPFVNEDTGQSERMFPENYVGISHLPCDWNARDPNPACTVVPVETWANGPCALIVAAVASQPTPEIVQVHVVVNVNPRVPVTPYSPTTIFMKRHAKNDETYRRLLRAQSRVKHTRLFSATISDVHGRSRVSGPTTDDVPHADNLEFVAIVSGYVVLSKTIRPVGHAPELRAEMLGASVGETNCTKWLFWNTDTAWYTLSETTGRLYSSPAGKYDLTLCGQFPKKLNYKALYKVDSGAFYACRSQFDK